jgi:hypothetical protein
MHNQSGILWLVGQVRTQYYFVEINCLMMKSERSHECQCAGQHRITCLVESRPLGVWSRDELVRIDLED